MNPEDIAIVQGVPLSKQYRFVNAALTWPGAAGCEARAQVRRGPSNPIQVDLTPHLTTPAVVTSGDGAGTDIVVTLVMTGADTRAVTSGGMYDLYLSDTGMTDARAMRVAGNVSVTPAITDP